MKREKVNIKIEYESTPIRSIAIECPECKNWFYGSDICKENVSFDYQLYNISCQCPKCNHLFTPDPEIQECSSSFEVYENTLKKEVKWT